MSDLADQIQKLQDLHASGALTDDEFAHAKAAVLAGDSAASASADSPALQAHLSQIERQNSLSQLDRNWDRQQQQYTVRGRYGRSYIPTQGGSLAGGIIIAVFGVFWTIMASSMGAPAFFPLFGILFIVVGIVASVSSYAKAGQYRQAQDDYQRRRADLLDPPQKPSNQG